MGRGESNSFSFLSHSPDSWRLALSWTMQWHAAFLEQSNTGSLVVVVWFEIFCSHPKWVPYVIMWLNSWIAELNLFTFMMSSFLSSTITAVSSHLKPHRAEALQRIRLNGLCLVTALIVSYLLPVPSLLTAARILLTSSHHQRWSIEWVYEWICVFGMLIELWWRKFCFLPYWFPFLFFFFFLNRNGYHHHVRV